MGMFDTIKCEYKLPLPEDLEECDSLVWDEIEFQSKSLGEPMFGASLDTYTITEDGQLYLDKMNREWVEDESEYGGHLEEKEDGVEKQDYTGEIDFYHLHMGEEQDYWMEFKAIFYKGELKELTREGWKKQDNSDRIHIRDEVAKGILKAKAKQKKWWFPFYVFYVKVIRFVFGFFAWTLGQIIRFISWLEQKIT